MHLVITSVARPRFIFVVLAAIALLLPRAAAAQTPPQFLPPSTFSSGGANAFQVTLADVNGDGLLDAIAANGTGGVGVSFGNGDGTFRPPVTYPPGCSSVAVADVNADGTPDLVVTVAGEESSVAVLLGIGDGTFQPAVWYPSGLNFALDVKVADLNNDGKVDLAVGECGPEGCSPGQIGAVGVLLGNGDGTFRRATTYAGGQPRSIALGDVNRDGRPDVVTANWQLGTVGVWLGNGDGSFQTMRAYDAGAVSPQSIALADLNGDGRLDIAVASYVDHAFSPGIPVGVLLGNGDGTFQPVVNYPSGGIDTAAVAVADVNVDGIPDLLASSGCLLPFDFECAEGHVGVLIGHGDGTFQPAVLFPSGGRFPASLASADLNADGANDIVVANFGVGGPAFLGVLLNALGDTLPPAITASASPDILWPANSKMVSVRVTGTIRDSGTGVRPGSAAYAVVDEYGRIEPHGSISVASDGSYSVTVLLQASREGGDRDGRHYTMTISAADKAGNIGSKQVVVIVPHDQGAR
jgi:hypothetical protein